MHGFLVLGLLSISAAPLLSGLAAAQLTPEAARRTASWGALLSLAAAGVSTGALVWGVHASVYLPVPHLPWIAFSLRFDGLSAVMTGLVSVLGLTVIGYSGTYLEGDPRLPRFLSWMSLALSSVLTLLLANNLVVIAAAWIATSVCLHHLLLHYPERPAAVLAARNKFIVSRIGDICLISASAILISHYGTSELDQLFAKAAFGDTGPLPSVCMLLACCALLKSAQVPFHSWLPDTMETPTPVSAFMHAGIINAGGFLILRLSPLMAHAPNALTFVGVVGIATAAFGSVVMLACPSVKRALAFSTMAQMGFMFFECGTGAFGLALLHLVSHSAYKAHAFLTSGSTIGATPRKAVALPLPALAKGVIAAAAIMVACLWGLPAVGLTQGPSLRPFDLIFLGAIAYGLARLWAIRAGTATQAIAVALACVLILSSHFLHAACDRILGPVPTLAAPQGLMLIAALAFGGLFLVQAILWRSGAWAPGRRIYLYALNGFYVGTYTNRYVDRIWPRDAA